MLETIQITLVLLTIMGLLLGIPYFLVYMTERENNAELNWNSAHKYFLETGGVLRIYDAFFLPIATLVLTSGIMESNFVSVIIGLGLLLFGIFVLISVEVIKSQKDRLGLLFKGTSVLGAILFIGIFTKDFKIITYLWATLVGFYAAFKSHEAIILHRYQSRSL